MNELFLQFVVRVEALKKIPPAFRAVGKTPLISVGGREAVGAVFCIVSVEGKLRKEVDDRQEFCIDFLTVAAGYVQQYLLFFEVRTVVDCHFKVKLVIVDIRQFGRDDFFQSNVSGQISVVAPHQ